VLDVECELLQDIASNIGIPKLKLMDIKDITTVNGRCLQTYLIKWSSMKLGIEHFRPEVRSFLLSLKRL
jgi:hypothetical protein